MRDGCPRATTVVPPQLAEELGRLPPLPTDLDADLNFSPSDRLLGAELGQYVEPRACPASHHAVVARESSR